MMRAAWLESTSFRVRTILSFASSLGAIVPLYFIAAAVQPVAASSIRLEGGDYFAFVLVGVASMHVVTAALGAIPAALAAGLGSGSFEAMLSTRTRVPVLLAGMAALPALTGTLRAGTLLVAASVAGVGVAWAQLPAAAIIVALVTLCYAGLSLGLAAAVLSFRTAGPLPTAIITASALLGGAYYSTSAVPGWLHALTEWVPLTYGLRATRQLLLASASPADVLGDLAALGALAALALVGGGLIFSAALRRARVTGQLAQG